MFFFSEARGIVAYTAGPIYGIYLTTDGGKSWTQAKVPNGFFGPITQIRMTDTSRGWATIEEPGNLPALWRTIDGGKNWTTTGITGNFSCVYETTKAITVTSRDKTRSGETSLDGGVSFQAKAALKGLNGIDFIDDTFGVITGYTNTPWLRTTDGGITWQTITPNITKEAWSVFADKDSKIFYVAGEGDPGTRGTTGNSSVMRSTDFGATWQTIHTFPFFTNGHIFGSKGHLYVQVENTTYNGTFTGLYRSDDGGFTWKPVGGPHHENDKRFFVTGCNGGIVYAFDDKLNLYKTRSGGDGTIFEPNPEPVIMGLPIRFSSRICDKVTDSVTFTNQYCDTLRVIGAQFLDPASGVVSSGAISILNASSFPRSIESGNSRSVVFLWDPSKYIHTDTSLAVKVRITFYSKTLLTTRDTTITITATAIGDLPKALVVPSQLSVGQIPFCAPKDTAVTITNTGCDTLSIMSTTGSAPISYQLLTSNAAPIVYPVRLAPGESFSYLVRLTLKKVGNYSSIVKLKLNHQGKIRDTTFSISASIRSTGSYAATSLLDFGNVTICAPKDTFITIKNLACDTLRLLKASLKFGAKFSIVKGITPPENLFTDSTKTIFVRFTPSAPGIQNDELIVEFLTLGDPIILRIPITGNGISGSAVLAIAPARDTLFDLKLTRCDAPQSYKITLSNPGCKNITINSVTLSNPSPNVTLTPSRAIPATFANGSAMSIDVVVTPKTIGNWSGLLHVKYQIQGDIERDTFLFYSLGVGFGKRVLNVVPDSINLGTFRLCTKVDTTITFRNTGCDSLELTNLNLKADGGTFTVLVQPRLMLAPGEITTMRLRYVPDRGGLINGSLIVTSTSDSLKQQTVRIIATIIPTDSIRFRLRPVRTTFFVGDTITIQLVAESAIDLSRNLRDISFNINFNGDLLTMFGSPKSLILNTNILAGTTSRKLPAKNEAQRNLFQGQPFLIIPANVPIIEFKFIVRLTDTTLSSLFLDGISLNGNDPNYAKCSLGFLSSFFDLDLTLRCGDSTLREFMRNGKVIGLRIAPTFPNPITSRTNYRASLEYTSASANTMKLVIANVRGNIISSENIVAKQGSNILTIDAGRFASGDYYFLLSPISSAGEAVSGKFVVDR